MAGTLHLLPAWLSPDAAPEAVVPATVLEDLHVHLVDDVHEVFDVALAA